MHRSLQFLLISVGLVSFLFGREFFQNRNLSQQLTQLQVQLLEVPIPVAPVDVVTEEERRSSLTRISEEERRKSRYLNDLVNYCRNSKKSLLPSAEFSETLEPNEDLAVLFELSENQMNELKAQSQRTREQIYAWEQERVVDVEEGDLETESTPTFFHGDKYVDMKEDGLTSRIPLGDELAVKIKEDFFEGIETVVGEENFTLIEHIAAKRFQPFEQERVISIATTQDSRGQGYFTVHIRTFDDQGNIKGDSAETGTLDSSLNSVPERYRHLFAIQFEEE